MKSAVSVRRSRRAARLMSPLEHCLEISRDALNFVPCGLGCSTHSEVTVDQPEAGMIFHRDAGCPERLAVSFALIAQWIVPCRADDGRRQTGEAACAQRGAAPVGVVTEVAEILSAVPLHRHARQEIARGVLRA